MSQSKYWIVKFSSSSPLSVFTFSPNHSSHSKEQSLQGIFDHVTFWKTLELFSPLIQDKMLISLAWRKESVVTWCLLPFQPPSQHPQLMLCNPSPQPAMLLGFLTCLPSHLFLSLFGVILCQPYHTWKMSVGVKIRDSGARSFVTYYDLFLFQFSHSFVSVW